MGIKKSVFASKAEGDGFRSIEHEWGDTYRILPSFPFSALFEPDKSIRDTSHLFYKTSVDYVLCTKPGKPLLAIDFDGLGYGHNRNGEYVQMRKTEDPYRKLKFDFKLKYAERCEFPYYVVSYDEFEPMGETPNMAVVQGIIGYVIAKIDFQTRIEEEVRLHQSSIEALPAHEQYEYIGDMVSDLEYGSWLEHSPMEKRIGEVFNEIAKLGGEVKRWNHDVLFEPDLPDLEYRRPGSTHFFDVTRESFEARLTAMDKAVRIGSVCSLNTSIGEVSDIAWMRNVGNFSQSMRIVKSVAELLAYEKCLRLLNRQKK